MSDQISLDARGLEAALAVLRREQSAFLPTTRQAKLYRAFNVSAFAMAGVTVLIVLFMMSAEALEEVDEATFEMSAGLVAIVAGLLSLTTLVLFILNAGLMRKLYRHAQLRRRLKLAYYFQPAFSAQRKASPLGNLVTKCIIVLGALVILFGVLMVTLGFAMWLSSGWLSLDGSQLFVFLLASCAIIGVGLGMCSLHFVRRGNERLEVVQRLQEMLSKQAADPATGDGATVSPEEYNAIARIERAQIIRDRASSIVSARKEAEAAAYMCQTSRQMWEAKSRLAPEVLAKVEGTIDELLRNPAPAGGSVPVAGTPLRIQFDVDPGRHLVRLHGVTEG